MLYCVVDMSNILHRTFHVNTINNYDTETLLSLSYMSSLLTLNKYYQKYSPDQMVFIFDRENWRVDYTQSEACVSKRLYKGHRRENMTQKQKDQYKIFKQFILDFEVLMRDHTSIACIAEHKLEADDLIAGFCEEYHKNADIIVLSEDKDLIQLLQYPSVSLIRPADGTNRTLDEWNNDADYFMFMKAIRGDAGDNVQSALPRVHKTKILEAYNDEYKRCNLMDMTWVNQESQTLRVGDLFEENMLLMDLTKQPEDIRQIMFDTIRHSMQSRGKYSHFHFLRFLGAYRLKNISKKLDQFIPLLSK